MGRTKIGLKLFFLSLLMVGCSTSGKLEYLCDSEDILSIYWNKGLLAGPSDIWLDAFRCPSTSDFRCLILEGYAISVGYDKNVKVGDEWFFNGSEFKYIMDFSGGERLFVSTYSDDTIKKIGEERRSKVSFIKIKNDQLIEFQHHYTFGEHKSDIRVLKSCGKNPPSFVSMDPALIGGDLDAILIDTCRTENSFLCYKPQLKK